jgi:hypothetical protein
MSVFFRQVLALSDEKAAENTGYFWWFKFMQLVEGYDSNHPLWKDFGELKRPFIDWFEDVGYALFDDGAWPAVTDLWDEKDYERAREKGFVIVAIDPSASYREIMRQIGYALEVTTGTAKKGRRSHEDEIAPDKGKHARYSFAQRPDVLSLSIIYRCWVYKQENAKASLYEVGEACNVLGKNKIKSGDSPAVIADKKRIVNATVSRYLRKARKLIENVQWGDFPCFE